MNPDPPRGGLGDEHGIDALLEPWRRFGNGWMLLDMLIVLALALALVAGLVAAAAPALRAARLDPVVALASE